MTDLVRMTATALWYATRLDAYFGPDAVQSLDATLVKIQCATGISLGVDGIEQVKAAYQELFVK